MLAGTYIHSNTIVRRHHKKSRTGCRACKERRVKCDEKKPVCGKCAIHFSNLTKCDYGSAKPQVAKSRGDILIAPLPTREAIRNSINPKTKLKPGAFQPIRPTGNFHITAAAESHGVSETRHISNPKPYGSLPIHDDLGSGCPFHHEGFNDEELIPLSQCKPCGNLPLASGPINNRQTLLSDEQLLSGKVDPFASTPIPSSPQVQALMFYWVNTFSYFPTSIHSEYCTNPYWLSTAMTNPALFSITLYVSSLHMCGLQRRKESYENLYYKMQTTRYLNEVIRNPETAITDETISTVMFVALVISVTGEPEEVQAHIKGLKQMVKMRGGIQDFTSHSILMLMLCTTNHTSAVLAESPLFARPASTPTSSPQPSTSGHTSPSYLQHSLPLSSTHTATQCHEETRSSSPKIIAFAHNSGFHPILVFLLDSMYWLHPVLDAFTLKFLTELRPVYETVLREIELDGVGERGRGGGGR
ncbi:hypothetical protein BGZ60DRAFT_531765 [Tricladium varicosporioides]|nr:hypothetical protein BGZ60DRAFT_531765 [Hymenoscyphus varicosporioides]